MEGCQHNTMDVEYFGPNPQMASWYLGALRAGAAMARALGEDDFATKCDDLAARGRAWVDANLFNGEYYEHEIRPPRRAEDIRPGLAVGMGAKDVTNPDFQLGAGCLIDQLAGQANAHFERLGHVLDARHQRAALHAVLRYNHRDGFLGHFNHMRSYVLGDDAAVLMASYPLGRRPRKPFSYYTEVMTGFEYYLAVHLVQEGDERAALQVVRDIRARYDGRKRNPFDEAECGHHYARALAAWGLVPALTGFHYSALDGTLVFARPARTVTWPWAAAGAAGTVRLTPRRGGCPATLTVTHGRLRVAHLEIAGVGRISLPRAKTLAAGRSHAFLVTASA